MERRALQGVLGVLSLIPLLGLVLIWSGGPAYFLGGRSVEIPTSLDNQLRYFAGVYFGTVTLALWWAIPRIEDREVAVRIAAGGVFFGGVGRLVSIASVGLPEDPTMLAGVVLELVGAPLLAVWQRRIARCSRRAG